LLLQGLDEGQPLLEKLSLVDNFVHLGLVFGLGLVLLHQHLLPLAQLDREALFRSLHIHSNEVAIRQSARKPNAHEASLHIHRLYPNLLLERFAAVLDFSHVPLQQRDGVIAAL
jgi:hypothetical protein